MHCRGKVRRPSLATGAAAAVILGGLAYGLSAAATTATVAASQIREPKQCLMAGYWAACPG